MDIDSGLLVAIMFVILLSLGIAHVVMAMADIVGREKKDRPDWLLGSWTLLLLLLFLKLFWHTIDLLNVDAWDFGGFLYVVAGPILLFFASSVLLPVPESSDSREHYRSVSRRFFGLLALLQAWIIGVDLFLGSGFTTATALNGTALVLFVVLASIRRSSIHAAGALGAAAVFIAAFAL